MIRMRAPGIAVAAVVAAALVAPASAGAIRFEGKTTKGVRVELRVSPGGKPKLFEVGATKVSCREGTIRHRRRRYRHFDRARADHFADHFKQRVRDGGIVLRERTRYEGDVRKDGSWRGTYEINSRVYRDGERIDTCNLRTRWTATRSARR